MTLPCPRCRAENASGYCAVCGHFSPSNENLLNMRNSTRTSGPRVKKTSEEQDRSFAGFLGVIAFGATFLFLARRGHDTDASLVIAVLTGVLSAWILRRMPFIVRPLRWLATAALVYLAIAAVGWLLR